MFNTTLGDFLHVGSSPFRDIPPFNDVDMLLDEEKLRNDLGIRKDEPAADYYCHYIDCV